MAKILLVEDDNNLREIYAARLSAEGYQIVSAPDGEEALAIAVKEKPDLIITDVMMPKISGFDMLDILRNAPETKDTKIIMMTALSQAEDKERADKLGADMYLVKSQVTLEDVVASVHKIVGEGSGQASPQPAADAAPAPEAASSPAAETPPAPAADTETTPPPAPVTEPAAEPTAADEPAQPAAPPAPEPTPAPAAAPEPAAEQPQPTPETAPPAPAAAPEPSAPAPEPTAKKIEVVLPDEADKKSPQPDEQKPEEQKPAEAKQPPETVAQAPADSTGPSVGPNLAEALAEEEKSGETPAAPVSSSLATDTASEAEATPSAVIKPEPPAESTNDEQQAGAPVAENHNTKVIQPLNDPNKGPDLQELLAQEEAKEIQANPSQTPPADTNPGSPEHPDDFSKISL